MQLQTVIEIELWGDVVYLLRRRPWRVYDSDSADCALLLSVQPYQSGPAQSHPDDGVDYIDETPTVGRRPRSVR